MDDIFDALVANFQSPNVSDNLDQQHTVVDRNDVNSDKTTINEKKRKRQISDNDHQHESTTKDDKKSKKKKKTRKPNTAPPSKTNGNGLRKKREPFDVGVIRAAKLISTRTHKLNEDMSISVQNIVASVQIVYTDTPEMENVRLSHRGLVDNIFKQGAGCSCNSLAFQSIKIKTNDGTLAIFCHGELIFTGVTSVESTKKQLEMLRPKLPLHRPFIFADLRVLNIVYSFDTQFRLNLHKIQRCCNEYKVKYEPEKFPGCIITLKEKDEGQKNNEPNPSTLLATSSDVLIGTLEESEDIVEKLVNEAAANSKVVSICFATGKGIITGCIDTASATKCARDLYNNVLIRYKDTSSKPVKKTAATKAVSSNMIPLIIRQN